MQYNKKQQLVYAILTILFTVPCFVFYCSSLEAGGFNVEVIKNSWIFIPIEMVLALICEELVGSPLANKLLQKHVNPEKHNALTVWLATIAFTVAIMCPLMSFLATILYDGIIAVGMNGAPLDNYLINFVPLWLQKVVQHFAFALLLQVFAVQPLVTKIFATYFKYRSAPQKSQELAVNTASIEEE